MHGLFKKAKASFGEPRNKERYRTGFGALKMAACLGHVGADEWLGATYDYGLGTRVNRVRAFRHYLRAANKGNANAQYHVGVFYFEGRGVSKKPRSAIRWFAEAAKQQGHSCTWVLLQARMGRKAKP
jgi:hypothetical protein